MSAGLDRPPGALIPAAPFYEEAMLFDSVLQGKGSEKDWAALSTQCKSRSNNPFCPSVKRFKQITKVRDAKFASRSSGILKPLIPIHPEWKNGKVTNWNTLRKASVQGLIKGLLAVESKELHSLIEFAHKEKRCPNNIAVAIAATLEDLLPDHTEVSQIASLYQQGARCTGRDLADKEHFLTRAALLNVLSKKTKKAEEILSKVKPQDAFSGRALYWLYRTRLELGDSHGASRSFHQLTTLHPFSFHALLALKSIGQDPGSLYLEKREVLKNRSETDQRLNQYLYQVELLNSHRLESSASILVDWLLDQKGIEPRVRLYLASLGDARARTVTGTDFLYRRSSLLTRQTMELIFPKPYLPLFEDGSSRLVSPFLGLAVARKESVFNPRAVSIANAQGLLQLNPETSSRLTGGRSHDLFDPKTNTQLGMRYLNELMARYSGSVMDTLAAYNAGEDAVAVWRKRFAGVDPVLWMDLIPYRETRDYVGLVLANYFWYRRLYEPKQESPELF